VHAVDAGVPLADSIPPDRVIGCVGLSRRRTRSARRGAPGRGRPACRWASSIGSNSERVARISAAFTRAGFKAPVLADIRAEIWLKLWGQPQLQPDQRAVARHAGRHLRFPAVARAGPPT
jgi:2-dehydropantoate 2-reductase